MNRPATASGMRTASTNTPSCRPKRYFTNPSEGSVARSTTSQRACDRQAYLPRPPRLAEQAASVGSHRGHERRHGRDAPRFTVANRYAMQPKMRRQVLGAHPKQVRIGRRRSRSPQVDEYDDGAHRSRQTTDGAFSSSLRMDEVNGWNTQVSKKIHRYHRAEINCGHQHAARAREIAPGAIPLANRNGASRIPPHCYMKLSVSQRKRT